MRTKLWMVAAAMVMLAAGRSFAKTALDLSEPKAAAKTFINAVADGDIETAKAAAIANEKQQAWIESLSAVMVSYQKLDTAMATKFGKATDADAEHDMFSGMRKENILKELEAMRVEIKDDTARFLPPKQEGQSDEDVDQNLVLKKVDGQWKVDVSSMNDGDMENMDQSKKFATMLDKLTADIESGKLKTRQEVMAAMMGGAMGEDHEGMDPTDTTMPAPDAMPEPAPEATPDKK